MNSLYIFLCLFITLSPAFAMEKAPYTPGSGKRLYELITSGQLDSDQDQSSPKTPRLFDETETEPSTPFNFLAPTPLNSQMEQEAEPQSIVQAQTNTQVPASLQTFFNTINICRICSENIGKNKLAHHFNSQHQGQKPFKCPACDFTNLTWKHTPAHIVDNHIQKYDPKECWVCSQKINDLKDLIYHFEQKHPNLRPYKCPQCTHTSRNASNIKMHIASHFHQKLKATSAQENKAQLISLPFTPTVLNSLAEPPTPQIPQTPLNLHMIEQEPMEQEAVPQSIIQSPQASTGIPATLQTFFNTINTCRICSANIDKDMLPSHFDSQHQGQKPFKCPACDFTNLTWKHTPAHIVDNHIQKYDPQECWVCLLGINSECLITHFKEKHPELKPYKCPQCSYTSHLIYWIKHHMVNHFLEKIETSSVQEDIAQLISLPSTPTVLNLLAQSPTQQTPLNARMTEQEPIEQEAELQSTIQPQATTEGHDIFQTFLNNIDICRICSKNIGKNNLVKHFSILHEEQKQQSFKCPKCEYAPSTWKGIATHIIDKHIQRYNPKECWVCSQEISDRRTLNAHFKEKHPNLQPYKCPQCLATYNQIFPVKAHIVAHFLEKSEAFSAVSQQKNSSQTISIPSTPTVLNYLNIFNSYPCTYEKCGQIFSTEQELIEHLNTQH